jgi:hypothetical protein
MSQNYVENKIKEALKKASGNKALARQQLIAWAMDDTELLQGLTRAHLSGIAAYNIDRVLSGRRVRDANKPKPKAPPKGAMDVAGGEFGAEILKAVAGNSGAMFGFDDGTPRGKTKVSQSHINALKLMSKMGKARY